MKNYPFCVKKPNYSFTPFAGLPFIKKYLTCRKKTISAITKSVIKAKQTLRNDIAPLSKTAKESLLKQFEINKILINKKKAEEYDLYNYTLFCTWLINKYSKKNNLKYLNALLKINDVLTSKFKKRLLDQKEKNSLLFSFKNEITIIKKLFSSNGVKL